jgi:glycosyltransferase involved in cell wall biosynthesis
VPLISTATGVRGFPLVSGRHYVAAEDADGFAQAILATLADPDLARSDSDRRAREGRALAETFAWERVGAAFAEAVARVVQGRDRAVTGA